MQCIILLEIAYHIEIELNSFDLYMYSAILHRPKKFYLDMGLRDTDYPLNNNFLNKKATFG